MTGGQAERAARSRDCPGAVLREGRLRAGPRHGKKRSSKRSRHEPPPPPRQEKRSHDFFFLDSFLTPIQLAIYIYIAHHSLGSLLQE